MTAAAAIKAFTTGLSIVNFINDHYDQIEQDMEWAQLRADIDALGNLPNAVINQSIAQSLGDAGTALNLLAQYGNTEDAGARDGLALEAIVQSERALNAVMDQVQSALGTASVESLVYAYSALHYSISVRQEVAATVQDGPLGSAGLHETLREAMELMYTPGGNGADIYSNITPAIADQIDIGARDFGFLGLNVTVHVTSPLSGASRTIDMDRGVVIDPPLYIPDPFFGTQIPIPNTGGPRPETDAEFFARISTAEAQAKTSLRDQERSNIDIAQFHMIVQEMAEGLASSSNVVDGLHERIGSSGIDIETGTDLADYFSGLGGDDVLNGAGGSDALSGGSGDDLLIGGDGSDFLRGGAGNDKLYGDSGDSGQAFVDVARFDGLASEYVIEGGIDFAVVSGPDGNRDELFDIEFLRFDDGDIALPEGSAPEGGGTPEEIITPPEPAVPEIVVPVPQPVAPPTGGGQSPDFGLAAEITLLYEAALNRDGAIDLPGLNFYIDVAAEADLSLEFLAADLMNSFEFTESFGDVEEMSDSGFLGQIYENVLDRPADPAGMQFYLDLLEDEAISRAMALADIATSPENTLGSADIIGNLVEAIPGEWSFLA